MSNDVRYPRITQAQRDELSVCNWDIPPTLSMVQAIITAWDDALMTPHEIITRLTDENERLRAALQEISEPNDWANDTDPWDHREHWANGWEAAARIARNALAEAPG